MRRIGLVAGPEIKMIGVAEDDLGAERLQNVLRNRLHAACCADRHEDRSLDHLMRQDETARDGRLRRLHSGD
jgi:hypothetical protein